ncbi:MAG: hypothetical protein U9M94_04515 [Patescibacteria group bacterium]|nr:hypothetical protein [Patescibacteria group bacterium]
MDYLKIETKTINIYKNSYTITYSLKIVDLEKKCERCGCRLMGVHIKDIINIQAYNNIWHAQKHHLITLLNFELEKESSVHASCIFHEIINPFFK